MQDQFVMEGTSSSTEQDGTLITGHQSAYTFRGLTLTPFERQLITGNRCEAFLEMKCIFHSDSMDVYYNTEHYLRICDVLRSGLVAQESFYAICREFLESLKVCQDYLLTVRDLSFRDENLYCTRDFSAVRLMYIPGCRNTVSVREKLIDLADTAIESGGGDLAFVSSLSEYKNRLYTGGADLRSLSILTEESARKQSTGQRTKETDREPDRGESEKRREKGIAVKFSVPDRFSSGAVSSGGFPAFAREEHAVYEQSPEENGSPSTLRTRIRNLFNDLVS